MTHSCESSRARARLLSGTLPIHPPSCGHTHDVKDRVKNNNNRTIEAGLRAGDPSASWLAWYLAAERVLADAYTLAGGPLLVGGAS